MLERLSLPMGWGTPGCLTILTTRTSLPSLGDLTELPTQLDISPMTWHAFVGIFLLPSGECSLQEQTMSYLCLNFQHQHHAVTYKMIQKDLCSFSLTF